MIKIIKENPVSTSYIIEAPDSKARYEIAENIASWVFGSPNMNDIDDNLDFLVNRFMKGSTLVDRMYMCDTYEKLADVLSNCSLKLLMTIERGLCIDEDSISCETDYIKKMYGESRKRLREQDVEIEVKHEGILEVPEGKSVEDLPIKHFVDLAKKKGLSKITKALNNLQVWNKKKNPSLSKWAGDMIDKVSKRMEKNESISVNMFNEGWYNGDAVIEFTHNDDLEADLEEFLFDLFGDNPDVFDFDWSGRNTKLYLNCDEDDYNYIKWFIKDWKYKHRDEYDEFDESLKLKESSMYDYYDTPDNEYATSIGDTIPEEEPDKSYRHSLKVPEDKIEDFARFAADYFNEDLDDIINNKSDVIWMTDFNSYGNRYITIVCSDEEYEEIKRWLNKKSLRTKKQNPSKI